MRVLSLSHRMQNPLIDNHSIFNAPAVFDYEGIVVDAGGVFETIRQARDAEQAFQTFTSIPVVNGESLDGVVGIGDVLRRRTDEFVRALERGSVVVVFAYPPAVLTGVSGMGTVGRYFWLPRPRGLDWDARPSEGGVLRAGEGNAVAIVDHGHPLARVIDVLRSDLLYRAYLDDHAPAFPGAHVIARTPAGAPVAAQFRVLNGTVVFLPSPREAGARYLASKEGGAMVEAVRELLGRSDEQAPHWVREAPVPGLPERERTLSLATAARERAEQEESEARKAVEELALIRDVLWRGPERALRAAVVRCLEQLGFGYQESAEGDAVLKTRQGQELLLEVEGANDRVDMAPHYRLRSRLEGVIERRSNPTRGLIVVNGHRLTHPANRRPQYTQSLRAAAESMSYAVLTATQLFDAAVAAMLPAEEGGLPPEAVDAIRARLRETNGVVDLTDLIGGEPEEAPEEAPKEPPAADVDITPEEPVEVSEAGE